MTLYSILVVVVLLVVSSGLEHKEQCSAVSRTYTQLGYPTIDVPRRAKHGKDLRICSKGVTCCTDEMEENLKARSSKEFALRLADITEFTRTTFITATAQFNKFFLDLLDSGQSELDTMFSIAYGLRYKQNEDVFNDLFDKFRQYYKGGNISLTESMHKFFNDIFLRMFALQNPEYELSNEYLKCVGRNMNSLQPFGTIPLTLTKNIRQAFVAARTFVQGLAVGRNVALKMAEVQPTVSCTEAYTKQSFCPLCQGLTSLRPCHEYCMNVMKGCLAYHAEIDASWSKYLAAMEGLAERLEGAGSFNIEVVITPFKDLISEAIMEYHSSSSKSISDKVFGADMCGRPPPAGRRNKRGTRIKQKQRQSQQSLASKKGTLNAKVSDIKAKIREITSVWKELPDLMCKGRVTATKGSSRCWNGESEGRYNKKEMGSGLSVNTQNPEVWVSPDVPNPIIREQIQELDKATKHLSNAKLGIDVDWLDFDINELPVLKPIPTGPQMGAGDKIIEKKKDKQTEPTTTEKPKEISKGTDFELVQSGSGNVQQATNLDDTEDGDDVYEVERTVPAGSGWNSNIVRITPFEKPRRPYKPKGEDKNKNKETTQDGSGTLVALSESDDDLPIAVPVLPSNANNFNKNVDPFKPYQLGTIEGSGDNKIGKYYNYDDEDIPKRLPGAAPRPTKPNIIQAGSTQQNFATRTSTPKSVANIYKGQVGVVLVSCLISIAYIFPNWIT